MTETPAILLRIREIVHRASWPVAPRLQHEDLTLLEALAQGPWSTPFECELTLFPLYCEMVANAHEDRRPWAEALVFEFTTSVLPILLRGADCPDAAFMCATATTIPDAIDGAVIARQVTGRRRALTALGEADYRSNYLK